MQDAMTQKLINDGNAAVDEMLEGVMAAHGDLLQRHERAPRATDRALERWRW
jgi:phosphoenolpyruvate---glycerone phosphotransferase subunit DhaK